MQKQHPILFLLLLALSFPLLSVSVELNMSYDHYRGVPDGGLNGNTGVLWTGNGGMHFLDFLGVQLGGSYGIYNWDGRQNLVFHNPKKLQQIGFLTAGVFSSFYQMRGGLVYDRMFTNHFGVYDENPTFDQLRFQGGVNFWQEEIGLWGTAPLFKSMERVFGMQIKFKTIAQINLFWTHYFANCATTTLWGGIPYDKSLKFRDQRPGNWIVGFSFKAPLTYYLQIEGAGYYMGARDTQGLAQTRDHGAALTVGITYLFNREYDSPYLPVANHTNFLVDTNINQ